MTKTNWLDLKADALKVAREYVEDMGREAVATRVESKGYDVVVRFRATDGEGDFALGLHIEPTNFELDVMTELEADYPFAAATVEVVR